MAVALPDAVNKTTWFAMEQETRVKAIGSWARQIEKIDKGCHTVYSLEEDGFTARRARKVLRDNIARAIVFESEGTTGKKI